LHQDHILSSVCRSGRRRPKIALIDFAILVDDKSHDAPPAPIRVAERLALFGGFLGFTPSK